MPEADTKVIQLLFSSDSGADKAKGFWRADESLSVVMTRAMQRLYGSDACEQYVDSNWRYNRARDWWMIEAPVMSLKPYGRLGTIRVQLKSGALQRFRKSMMLD